VIEKYFAEAGETV